MDSTYQEVVRGDDYSASITFKEDGVAINITGYTVYFSIKDNFEQPDDEAIYLQTVTVHTSPTTGQTAISIPRATTKTFLVKNYVYDVKLLDASNNLLTTIRGTFGVLNTARKAI